MFWGIMNTIVMVDMMLHLSMARHADKILISTIDTMVYLQRLDRVHIYLVNL
jgi:hypothetical protein